MRGYRERERGKDRENGQRDGNEDWGLGKRGIVEQREDRRRDEGVREREVEHMGVRGRLGEDVYECNIRLLTQCHVKTMKAWRHFHLLTF